MQKSFTAKLWKVMKICAAQTLIALTLCGISLAHSNYAQILDKQITISLSDVPFEEALKKIEQVAKVKFAFSTNQLENEEPVSVSANDRSLRDLLEELLGPRNIGYKVHEREKMITLKKHAQSNNDRSHYPEEKRENKTAPFLVTGIITDAGTKQPMAGVNILVKGTTRGTTSDADGNFTIEAEDGEVLVFSFIGYAPHELKLSGQTDLRIALQEDIKSLKEVVVNAGYWTIKKQEQTGNIVKVEGKDIEKQPVSNPLLALQGRMAGVVITPRSGNTGSAMNIEIRGRNSLRTDGNYPLYVIDGVPVDSRPITSLNSAFNGLDPLNTINPNNIESVEILKDADATSIYGSRGANGVVLITTKKGVAGKTSVDISAYSGVAQFSSKMELLNTPEYLAMRTEALGNDGLLPLDPAASYNFPDMLLWDQTSDTDWQELLLGGTATISDIQMSLSGGTETTSFRFGGGYHNESTIYPGDFGYKKITSHLNLNHHTPNKKGTFSLSLSYGVDKNDVFSGNAVYPALTLPPNAPLYDELGNLDWSGYDFWVKSHPLSQFRVMHTGNTNNLIASSVLRYQIIDGLHLKVNLGYSNIRTEEILSTPRSAMDPAAMFSSESDFNDRHAKNWSVEPQLHYEKNLGAGKITALLGSTWQESLTTFQMLRGVGFASDDLLKNLDAASSVFSLGSNDVLYRYNAAFARVAYNWKSKYYINLTGRRDGSSRFGPNRKFANFGAAGLAWIFSNEDFFQEGVGVLSFGKLRTSYGTTGSDQVGDYGYLSTLSMSNSYQGISTFLPDALANPDFAWEVNKKLEVGLDLGFFDDRLQFATSWYLNRSSNQLVGYPLPAITGFTSVQANLPATVQNRGLEFEVQTNNIDNRNFSWSSSLNITLPTNELTSFPNLMGSPYANTYVVGEPTTISKVYHYTGLDPETGEYTFLDVNGDGTYNNLDRQTVVNLGRRMYGGLANTIRYRAFTLTFLIEFVEQDGRDYRNIFLEAPGTLSNQAKIVIEGQRWQQSGDDGELKKFATNSTNYRLANLSDLNVANASFLRVKTANLAYALPTRMTDKIGIAGLNLFLSGQNLLTFTEYMGLDPEGPGTPNLPQLRVFTGGLNLKF